MICWTWILKMPLSNFVDLCEHNLLINPRSRTSLQIRENNFKVEGPYIAQAGFKKGCFLVKWQLRCQHVLTNKHLM